MARSLVSDELWAAVAPLLPAEPPKPKGGRPRCDDPRVLEGIVVVLRSGIAWAMLPGGRFGCTGMTCWRRLRDWHAAGVWGRLHRILLERLAEADRLDWSRASIDSASIAAKGGARRSRRRSARTRRTAGGRARSATSWLTDKARRSASSRAARTATTAACSRPCSRPCSTSCPACAAAVDGHAAGPASSTACKAYDHRRCRAERRERPDRLGRHRWVVERTLAWLARFRRLTIRHERRADIHWTFTSSACSPVCLNKIKRCC